MAIRSMTGFGRYVVTREGVTVTVEMKSVNHRFGESHIRVPRECSMFEEDVRRLIAEDIKRGRTDVFVTCEFARDAANASVDVDWTLLDELVTAQKRVMEMYAAHAEMDVTRWLTFPDVIRVKAPTMDEDVVQRTLLEAVQGALHHLVAMRLEEGERLASDFYGKLSQLSVIVDEVKVRGPLALEERRAAMLRRVAGIGLSVDEARIEQEIVLLAERSAIDEEVVRLSSHVQAFRDALSSEVPIGRRLDFIVQEMHREVNTIGSKSTDEFTSRSVVDMKVIVEQLREQVQNIE